jgi:hypothetical protein
MAVRNLELSACEVGQALNVCETAASRKVGEAEMFITRALTMTAESTRSGRPDRVRTAVVQQIRTVAALAARHPEQLEPWIRRLMDEARPAG